jgi:hypothetical protein
MVYVKVRTEIGLLTALIVLTLITFVAFGVDTLGIVVLVLCLVCVGLVLANPSSD